MAAAIKRGKARAREARRPAVGTRSAWQSLSAGECGTRGQHLSVAWDGTWECPWGGSRPGRRAPRRVSARQGTCPRTPGPPLEGLHGGGSVRPRCALSGGSRAPAGWCASPREPSTEALPHSGCAHSCAAAAGRPAPVPCDPGLPPSPGPHHLPTRKPKGQGQAQEPRRCACTTRRGTHPPGGRSPVDPQTRHGPDWAGSGGAGVKMYRTLWSPHFCSCCISSTLSQNPGGKRK